MTSNPAAKMSIRRRPYVFTEQGVAMLSSVLRSKRAAQVNVEIMRAFVRLRELMATHKDLARKLDELERKYDENFRVVFDAIRQLMAPPPAGKRRPIGFWPPKYFLTKTSFTTATFAVLPMSRSSISRPSRIGISIVAKKWGAIDSIEVFASVPLAVEFASFPV